MNFRIKATSEKTLFKGGCWVFLQQLAYIEWQSSTVSYHLARIVARTRTRSCREGTYFLNTHSGGKQSTISDKKHFLIFQANLDEKSLKSQTTG